MADSRIYLKAVSPRETWRATLITSESEYIVKVDQSTDGKRWIPIKKSVFYGGNRDGAIDEYSQHVAEIIRKGVVVDD